MEEMDDNIYGVPYEHNKWLKIDIVTDSTSLVGDDLSKYGECKYNSGVVGEDCNVYAIPSEVGYNLLLNIGTLIHVIIY